MGTTRVTDVLSQGWVHNQEQISQPGHCHGVWMDIKNQSPSSSPSPNPKYPIALPTQVIGWGAACIRLELIFFPSLIKGTIKNSFSPANATRSQQHDVAGVLEISCAPKRQHFQIFHWGHWGHISPYVPWQQNRGEEDWSWISFWFILVVLPIFIGVYNLAVTLAALGCM